MGTAEQSLKTINPYRWVKGQSGNPDGASISRSPNLLGQLKRKLLAEADKRFSKTGEIVPGTLIRDQIIERMLGLAFSDDERVSFAACKEILDRVEGKAPQSININPTEINITLLAERLVEFAKKAKGVEIPAELAEKLILASLDQDKE